MLPRLLVVAHADEQHLARVARERSRILLFPDLPDGRLRRPVPLELDDERGLLRVLRTRQEREVDEALARWQLAHDVVEPPRTVKGQGQRIGDQRLPRAVRPRLLAYD